MLNRAFRICCYHTVCGHTELVMCILVQVSPPKMMMFGLDARMPIDLGVPHPEDANGEGPLMTTEEYVRQLRDKLQKNFKAARKQLKSAMRRQVVQYNKKGEGRPFTLGQGVLLYNVKQWVFGLDRNEVALDLSQEMAKVKDWFYKVGEGREGHKVKEMTKTEAA